MENNLDKFLDKIRSILLAKTKDYAGSGDSLSVFKKAAYMSNLSPEKVCLNQLAIKLARLNNLMESKGKPNFESVNDSLIDLACYCFLLSELCNENNTFKE